MKPFSLTMQEARDLSAHPDSLNWLASMLEMDMEITSHGSKEWKQMAKRAAILRAEADRITVEFS